MHPHIGPVHYNNFRKSMAEVSVTEEILLPFFPGEGNIVRAISQGCMDRTEPNLMRHSPLVASNKVTLNFRCVASVRSREPERPNFALLIPVEIRGGMGEISESSFLLPYLELNHWKYFWLAADKPSGRFELGCQESSLVDQVEKYEIYWLSSGGLTT